MTDVALYARKQLPIQHGVRPSRNSSQYMTVITNIIILIIERVITADRRYKSYYTRLSIHKYQYKLARLAWPVQNQFQSHKKNHSGLKSLKSTFYLILNKRNILTSTIYSDFIPPKLALMWPSLFSRPSLPLSLPHRPISGHRPES